MAEHDVKSGHMIWQAMMDLYDHRPELVSCKRDGRRLPAKLDRADVPMTTPILHIAPQDSEALTAMRSKRCKLLALCELNAPVNAAERP